MEKKHCLLKMFLKLTILLRRRVSAFEVLGEDMKARLMDCGIDPKRIVLRRDGSTVDISDVSLRPFHVRTNFQVGEVILYSGNWGVAHEIDTFFEGYLRHHRHGSGQFYFG